MATRGHLSISLLLENNSVLENGIWVKSQGLPQNIDDENKLEEVLEDSLEMEILNIKDKDLYDDNFLEGMIKRVCNKICQKIIGKKPIVTTFINRLN